MQITAALSMLLLAGRAAALGINCRGSTLCSGFTEPAKNLLKYIEGIDGNRWYVRGQQIACHGAHCAFIQSADGADGNRIRELARKIVAHGCRGCGSAPFANNDVSTGQLTFNYVDHQDCRGRLC